MCCFAALRQLRHLRRCVTDDCLQSLVVSLIHSRLDFGNFVLYGLPVHLQRRLQTVLNAAACMVYLEDLVRVADLPGRRRLRSSTTMSLHVPAHRLSTIGRRSFSVATPTTCNSLPADVQSSTSLPLFRQRLKIYLFKKSFPDVILF